MLFQYLITAALGLVYHVAAQTPMDFSPGSLVQLGVKWPQFELTPAGTLAPSLDLVTTVPEIMIPRSQLAADATGQVDLTRKYLIMMIDIDVVRDNTATTVLHWLQPDLMPQGDNLVLVGNSSSLLLKVDPNSTFDSSSAATKKRQAPPLPPPPAVNPNNIRPGAFGSRAQAVYFGPAPPPGPPHRYVQLVFAQPANFTFPACFQNILATDAGGRGDRLGFDINQFLQASSIRTRPVAGNYLRAQNPQPGSLTVNAATTSLRNNNCAGATPAAVAANPGVLRFRRLH